MKLRLYEVSDTLNSEHTQLYTAYHNMLKLIVGVSKREHTRPICVSLKVVYCPALIRKLIHKFIGRLINSDNDFISALYGISVYIDLIFGNTGDLCCMQME